MDRTQFKGYCWVIGSTSFRKKDFNLNIEKQLKLINEFRNIDNNETAAWDGNEELQKQYYSFLKTNGFVEGDAPRPAKDAREKTSGLVDIGLLSKERNITPAGKAMLEIVDSGDYSPNNLLGLNKDSYIFLKQLLKTSIRVDSNIVRPFVVFLHVFNQLESLSFDEFTYLLPLCISQETTNSIIKEILKIRNGDTTQEEVIIKTLLKMPNYKYALELFQTEEVTESLICEIGINRKSRNYDKPYFAVYRELEDCVLHGKENVEALYDAIEKLKLKRYWKHYLFSSKTKNAIRREGKEAFNEVPILNAKTLTEFKDEFFKTMHLLKAKATLHDYFDLNRRYFKASDAVIFENNSVRLDIIPQAFFKEVADSLTAIAFLENVDKENDVSIEEISNSFHVPESRLYAILNDEYGTDIRTHSQAELFIKQERKDRFNKIIDRQFSIPVLIELLDMFKNRLDDEIRTKVTDNADIPTIFEYILAIIWYEISERKGDVLEYMNLSLEADLLPKTHAAGGDADIVWKYDKTDYYPEHTLLIEATLSDGTNQRRMEMEPVSRHLGDYRLSHPLEEAYCVFAAPYLHPNVISDFRQRKDTDYYDSSGSNYIHGLKILGLDTDMIKTLLQKGVNYTKAYELFDMAYRSKETPAIDWYKNTIVKEINDLDSYYGFSAGNSHLRKNKKQKQE